MKRMQTIRTLAAIAALLCSVARVAAATDEKIPAIPAFPAANIPPASPETVPTLRDSIENIYNFSEVVVTATRTPLTLKNTPVITRVISAREIETSGARSIQEILSMELAGVEFHQAGFGTQMLFQGLDARYILFLIDGERMAGETYGNIDYARIPVGDIERIEIVRGASSVLYGSNAMGMVVNVITRTPKRPVEISASAGYGGFYQKDNNTPLTGIPDYNSKLDVPNIDANLSVGLALGKVRSQTYLSYLGVDAFNPVSAEEEERFYPELKITSITMGPRGPESKVRYVADTALKAPIDTAGLSVGGSRSFNVRQRFDYRVNDKLSLFWSGSYFNRSQYDFANSINKGSDGSAWSNESYNAYSTQAGAEYRPDARQVWRLTYYGDLYQRNLDTLELLLPKQRHVYNLPRLLWTMEAGRHNRVIAGAEFLNEALNFDLNPDGYDDQRRLNTFSAYAQNELTTNIGLGFVGGVRVDWNDRFGGSVTPKFSVKYVVGDFNFRANYARGYRNPSLKEMYMKYRIPMGGMSANSTWIVGNPDLKPEYNQYVSLSAEYTRGFFNASATGYVSYFSDKIDVRREQPDEYTTYLVYDNIDKSTFSGLELMLRARLVKGLFVMGNYNYIHQTENAPEASTQYIFVSPHTAALRLDYMFTCGTTDFALNLSGRFVGEKTYEDMMTIVELPAAGPQLPTIYSGNYTARADAYTTWGAMASVAFTPDLTFSVGGENLFNYVPSVVNFNSGIVPPRNFFVRMSYRFNR
ncbi:MAG: TonB-dependent receptor [Rikenellaceae bacterium]|jgi:outer membrane receptor for ferrienterochelin and colicins|nr:TonB-dependent receptor [Rikenellaceae bacterium]